MSPSRCPVAECQVFPRLGIVAFMMVLGPHRLVVDVFVAACTAVAAVLVVLLIPWCSQKRSGI